MNLLTSIDTHPGKSVDHPCAALALCLTLIFLASPLQAFDINHADGAFLVTITGGEDEETRLSSYLDHENIEHRVRTAESRESLGFIVVTEPFTDRLAATPMLGKLRDAGIRDFLFVGRGDYENRISIGVFSTRESADQRADQVNARGFDFSVIQRFRTVRGR
ncbi:MAG: SPOR domain-containing protein, partial [Proteobacteria bacterium]|nr:SPOR domain-containing protein [Pseudomonadota bacterium]